MPVTKASMAFQVTIYLDSWSRCSGELERFASKRNCSSVIDTVKETPKRSTVAGTDHLSRNSGSGIVRQRMERSVDESEAVG